MNRVLRDPAAYLDQAAHVGLFSNIEMLAWWTAAESGLAADAVLGRQGHPAWAPLAMGGLLSAVPGLDDLLLVHEPILPIQLGIPEMTTFAVHGGVTLLYLCRFRKFHPAMEAELLLASLVLFACSVVVDLATLDNGWWGVVLEDGAKFTGIVIWAAYHARSACRCLLTPLRYP